MNILICGFAGESNSSKILLDKITACDKIYLENDMDKSVAQIINAISKGHYDLVIQIGQGSGLVRCIDIEKSVSQGTEVFMSNYDYTNMRNHFLDAGYHVNVTHENSNYLCNNAFFNTLKYISQNNLNTKSITIHIPPMSESILCKSKLADVLNNFLKSV